MGAFLESTEATEFDKANHPWRQITIGAEWLRLNNPLIRKLAPVSRMSPFFQRPDTIRDDESQINGSGLPTGHLLNPENEATVPTRRPDIVVNPIEFETEIRNEDYRSHRLPAGVFQSPTSMVKHYINHGDSCLEMLVFPYLYPHGKGAWSYHGPALKRYGGCDTTNLQND